MAKRTLPPLQIGLGRRNCSAMLFSIFHQATRRPIEMEPVGAYENALTVYTKEAYPSEWGSIEEKLTR